MELGVDVENIIPLFGSSSKNNRQTKKLSLSEAINAAKQRPDLKKRFPNINKVEKSLGCAFSASWPYLPVAPISREELVSILTKVNKKQDQTVEIMAPKENVQTFLACRANRQPTFRNKNFVVRNNINGAKEDGKNRKNGKNEEKRKNRYNNTTNQKEEVETECRWIMNVRDIRSEQDRLTYLHDKEALEKGLSPIFTEDSCELVIEPSKNKRIPKYSNGDVTRSSKTFGRNTSPYRQWFITGF